MTTRITDDEGRLYAVVEIKTRKCPHCGEIFEVGPHSEPRRRGDALYCSPEHQERHNSLKRSV